MKTFKNCIFVQTEFIRCDLEKSKFINCVITPFNFQGSILENSSFTRNIYYNDIEGYVTYIESSNFLRNYNISSYLTSENEANKLAKSLNIKAEIKDSR